MCVIVDSSGWVMWSVIDSGGCVSCVGVDSGWVCVVGDCVCALWVIVGSGRCVLCSVIVDCSGYVTV
jgi:hypothetical protein